MSNRHGPSRSNNQPSVHPEGRQDDRRTTEKPVEYESKTHNAEVCPPAEQRMSAGKARFSASHIVGIRLRTATLAVCIFAVLIAAAFLCTGYALKKSLQQSRHVSDCYHSALASISDMDSAADYLADLACSFVMTGKSEYLDSYIEEIHVTRRREQAVADLEILLDGQYSSVGENIANALQLSTERVKIDCLAMRMSLESGYCRAERIPEELSAVPLSSEDLALPPDRILAKAQGLLFSDSYKKLSSEISDCINTCSQNLLYYSDLEMDAVYSRIALLGRVQSGLAILFFLIIIGSIFFIWNYLQKPLVRMIPYMRNHQPIPPSGIKEIRSVVREYNEILEKGRSVSEKLAHKASHDNLTGLFNRSVYDLLAEKTDFSHTALLLIDVDHFKSVNDRYGHITGDHVLRHIADLLRRSFRSDDVICRIGGDEFLIIMFSTDSSLRQTISDKINNINTMLLNPEKDLPSVSLSAGVAFSDSNTPQQDIFADADIALYQAKKAGRGCCCFYES